MQDTVIDVLDGMFVGSAAAICLAAIVIRPSGYRLSEIILHVSFWPRLAAFGILAFFCLDEAWFAGTDTVVAGVVAFAFWLYLLRGWWLPMRAAPASPTQRPIAFAGTVRGRQRAPDRRVLPEPIMPGTPATRAARSAAAQAAGQDMSDDAVLRASEWVAALPATIGYDDAAAAIAADDGAGGGDSRSGPQREVNTPAPPTAARTSGTTSIFVPAIKSAGRSAPAMVVNLEVRRLADGSSHFVLLSWPDGTTRRIGGFSGAAAATAWIEQNALAWITRRPKSYIRLAPVEAATAAPADAADAGDAASAPASRRDRRAGPAQHTL